MRNEIIYITCNIYLKSNENEVKHSDLRRKNKMTKEKWNNIFVVI